MTVLSLRFCARALSSCGKWGPLFIAVRGPPTIAASLVAEHRLQTRRLSNCGSRAQLLRGMWDPPRPGLEPVSPALAGRFSTTTPPGKPQRNFLKEDVIHMYNGVLLSHKKEWYNAICSNMDGPRDYYTKWSQTKTNIIWYHSYVESNFKKWYKWTYLQNRNRLTDIENKLMVTKEEMLGEG